ncbi:hypothetical protein [Salinisphaera sp.]|uniref:hypothetical protein n=1 Tax=Salinisphaera sp. TaxID=1914330 RepID=UPI000C5C9FAE|nr:hypothetical protein [Salinisphaera sp.]MAS09901.1 hypothetical protein [Salinisphaera sp.]MAS09956.1 hypothetical protein [Salinisphaera sp.]|tara:strand:- start:18637 stop:18876 length:240 start_codon:yes stop_codon:yes gene_type:complete
MAKTTINSPITGPRTFFIATDTPGESRYVFVDDNGEPGVLGKQPTYPGGATMTATPETLPRIARQWHKADLRERREFGA